MSEFSLVKLPVPKIQLYLKETPMQVISCEICEIFKSTFFNRTSPVAASEGFQPATLLKKETSDVFL